MNLSEQMASANGLLAPYATPHQGSLGRPRQEHPNPFEFPFLDDCNRITETNAFKRLSRKTQVYVSNISDHFHTRLTHTLDVANGSRRVARGLRLNEDHAEASALVHDIGHPPFGHQGEEALDELVQPYGMRFNHNLHGYRLVETIESLNLQREITHGMLKNGLNHPVTGEMVDHTLEAKVVDVMDRITYIAHDTRDGLIGELFVLEQLKDTRLGRDAIERAEATGPAEPKRIRTAIREMLIDDLVVTSEGLLQSDPSLSSIRLSSDMAPRREELYAFLKENMYRNPRVHERRQEGQRMIRKLFHYYLAHPPKEVTGHQRRLDCSMEQAIVDYMAGMTDTFLLSQAAQIA